MTLDELRDILVGCAGTTGEEFDSGTADASFDDLGYDSLVILEATARIQQLFGVTIPDEVTSYLNSPASMLAATNALQGEAGSV
jgi:act minimal PKS acyl carrier protein